MHMYMYMYLIIGIKDSPLPPSPLPPLRVPMTEALELLQTVSDLGAVGAALGACGRSLRWRQAVRISPRFWG